MPEFHVSRRARDIYKFDQGLFSQSGNVIFANFHAARLFAQSMNTRKDLLRFPEQAVRAGQINAMGLIDEILHMVIDLYRRERKPGVMADALDWLYGMLGEEAVDAALLRFSEEFPPVAVYRREITLDDYLAGTTLVNGVATPNRQLVLEEMLMLWIANMNPAFAPFQELFDDAILDRDSVYRQIIASLHSFFETQPVFGPDQENLVDMLRAPAIAVPHSLPGQLEYIRSKWGYLLGKLLYRLLGSLDLIQEENKAIFLGPGPSRVYDFRGMELEAERFSQDKDWMPNLVLLAKNAYVWLDQLSKQYQRPIYHLNDIPDAELDQLARAGFTGLWLIGLWERSEASRRIKQMRGNPEAVASAYSLKDYSIANDLGGEGAYDALRKRAWARGIRLASDMVPNHMGIDSYWVMEHPDWFVSLDYSPFPSYSFNGPNLSPDDRAGLYIEDHYYDSTDAAVVFKRVDHRSGETRYIYHGNDGTSMPWNDTAQLNYLKPEVREAVIQTILAVARRFPIIRFDAAMTLAKKHYQRLWFPEPGTGGAIPSRADFGLTKEQFDALMPEEFWREVVDRAAVEAPDTLLLAEAFWLMEGYFVRTLGMHRVYNSAFMNMLRDEKNAEYRLVIKNTLEFDPEILKRYVNFMNNPDERTAVDQFGKGDKYFGVCTLMATMPGLPMFGHGQVQGYTEKYGMEYRRAYWDESPDEALVRRHEELIFPLLRKRYLFADVKDFLLYDFFAPEGHVNEDVYAYSNRAGGERSLVVYHNKFASARGWIRSSAAYSVKTAAGDRTLVQKNLGEGLGLDNAPGMYTLFRDQITGLEYIRSNQELWEKGLYVELEAYKFQVFLDFRQVQDGDWRQWSQLAGYLNGRGVPNIDEAMREILLQPVHYPFRELVNAGQYRWIIDNRVTKLPRRTTRVAKEKQQALVDEVSAKMRRLVEEVNRLASGKGDEATIVAEVTSKLEVILKLPVLPEAVSKDPESPLVQAMQYFKPQADDDLRVWGTLLSWLFTHNLGKTVSQTEHGEVSRSWVDEWLLGKIIAGALQDLGIDEGTAWRAVHLVKLLDKHGAGCGSWGALEPEESKTAWTPAYTTLQELLADNDVLGFIGVNRYQGVLWYNKESFDDLLWWLFSLSVIDTAAREGIENLDKPAGRQGLLRCWETLQALQQAEAKSGYQLEKLVEAARG